MNKNIISRLKKVRHGNGLNSTLSALPMVAKKILFIAMSKINSKEDIDDNSIFYVSSDEYSDWTGIKSNNAYKELKEGAEVLNQVVLKLNKEDVLLLSDGVVLNFNEKNAPSGLNLNLTEFTLYYKTEGRVGVRFTKLTKLFLCKLIGQEKKYTTQVLLSAVRVKTPSGSSLYQLLRKMFSANPHANYFDISLNELKDELCLYSLVEGNKIYKYEQYPIFKRDYLNKAIEDVKKNTEIKSVSFEVINKIGRKTDKLRFTFEFENKPSLSASEKEFLQELDRKGI
ncbi:replication initiation protein [Escherichia coli]